MNTSVAWRYNIVLLGSYQSNVSKWSALEAAFDMKTRVEASYPRVVAGEVARGALWSPAVHNLCWNIFSRPVFSYPFCWLCGFTWWCCRIVFFWCLSIAVFYHLSFTNFIVYIEQELVFTNKVWQHMCYAVNTALRYCNCLLLKSKLDSVNLFTLLFDNNLII